MSARDRLVRVDDSVLVVVDVQREFLTKLSPGDAERVVERIRWLAGVAGLVGVPVLVTEEEPERNGPTAAPIAERLPAGVRRRVKPVFDLAACPEIVADVRATGRRTVVLVGLETDVCVAHSALGLLELGYAVAVVADATSSPGTAHRFGLERMRDAGVAVLGTKNLFYEWVPTVEWANDLEERVRALGVPEGVIL
jgi:nicotinamidase-related amidase